MRASAALLLLLHVYLRGIQDRIDGCAVFPSDRGVVLLYQLAAVLLVAQSHAPVLVRQSVEELRDRLVIFHVWWQLALNEKVLQLLLLLPSDVIEGTVAGTGRVADLIDRLGLGIGVLYGVEHTSGCTLLGMHLGLQAVRVDDIELSAAIVMEDLVLEGLLRTAVWSAKVRLAGAASSLILLRLLLDLLS